MAATSLLRVFAAIALSVALNSAAHAVVPLIQPGWSELEVEQRQILEPLANTWDTLDADRKKKWLTLSQRYASMTPEEQTRVKQRMKEWVSLSSAERKAARDNFTALQQAPAEHRTTMKETIKRQWLQYDNLSEPEKNRLRAEGNAQASPHKPTAPAASH